MATIKLFFNTHIWVLQNNLIYLFEPHYSIEETIFAIPLLR
jgi:hypothetical protein